MFNSRIKICSKTRGQKATRGWVFKTEGIPSGKKGSNPTRGKKREKERSERYFQNFSGVGEKVKDISGGKFWDLNCTAGLK